MLKFGANYVPHNSWFYSWVEFDESVVEKDFFALKEIGLDHLRVHLRWDLFQPATTYVSETMLSRLERMLDIAQRIGLELYVSVFTGWMSGLWFLPAWTRSRACERNIITDRKMIEAEKYLLRRLSDTIGMHSAFAGIDLGNELNIYSMHYHTFSLAEGDAWLKEMTCYCKDLFPQKEIVLGVDHIPWFSDAQFSRKCLAESGTMTSLHTWTKFTGALNTYGALSEENLSLIEYNVELANAYADDVDRKVWVQEFGVISEWMTENEQKVFLKNSIKNACRSDNLWGFTIWCSHEFDGRYSDAVDWETGFGILTKDNSLKPLGQLYKEVISEVKKEEMSGTLHNGKAIVIEETSSFEGWKYGEQFAKYIRKGEHIKFVLSSKVDDKEYLERRGIQELIYC